MAQTNPLGPNLDRVWRQSLVAAVVGIGLGAAGLAVDEDRFFQSYLVAYLFWTGIAVGCLAWAMLHQLVHGTWGLATGRLFECGAATLPLIAVLFLPIAYALPRLYPWAGYAEETAREVLGPKALYLNRSGFLYRSAGYLATWIVLAFFLNRWSRRRDESPSGRLTRNLRRLSAGGLLLLGLTMTFAAIDWVMSLEPRWYSTIYGALIAMGGMLAAFAFVITILVLIRHEPPLSQIASPQVFGDLGSLLLAFVILWAYLAFSQYLITYSGNTVEEITWYLRRFEGGWQWLALLVVVFNFAAPFLLLLSKARKQDSAALFRVACLLLSAGYVNVYWMIVPAFRVGDETSTVTVQPFLSAVHWLDLAVAVGMSGIWIAAYLWFVGRRPLLPPNDPAWENVAHRQTEAQA